MWSPGSAGGEAGSDSGEAADGNGRGQGKGRLGTQLGKLGAEDVVGTTLATAHGGARRRRLWNR
jgi:hypothetical protein